MLNKYTDFESMVADGILQPVASPNCVELMQREFIEYVVGESVTCAYPVLEIYSNPRKAMQGGFISAAFDNTFGALVYLVTQKIEMATIDLCVNYHKPIFENDKLEVVVYIKSLGKTIINLVGEAYDNEKNLIATATTNMIILDRSKEK
jgi:uncharacterized protein (TIGR00369 family)